MRTSCTEICLVCCFEGRSSCLIILCTSLLLYLSISLLLYLSTALLPYFPTSLHLRSCLAIFAQKFLASAPPPNQIVKIFSSISWLRFLVDRRITGHRLIVRKASIAFAQNLEFKIPLSQPSGLTSSLCWFYFSLLSCFPIVSKLHYPLPLVVCFLKISFLGPQSEEPTISYFPFSPFRKLWFDWSCW